MFDKQLKEIESQCAELVGKQRFSSGSHKAIYALLQENTLITGKQFTNSNSDKQNQQTQDILLGKFPSFAL